MLKALQTTSFYASQGVKVPKWNGVPGDKWCTVGEPALLRGYLCGLQVCLEDCKFAYCKGLCICLLGSITNLPTINVVDYEFALCDGLHVRLL